jgi:hypothetical protein
MDSAFATLSDAVNWERQSVRRCSECDEDGRGQRGLRKRRAVGDGWMVREAALKAALQQTWLAGVFMPECWQRRMCMSYSTVGGVW